MASVRQKIVRLFEYIDDEEPEDFLEMDDEELFRFVKHWLPRTTLYDYRLAQAMHYGDDDQVAEIKANRLVWLDRYAEYV